MNKIESPCVRNCCLNKENICTACLRSLDEIMEWGQASEIQKEAIMIRIESQKINS